MATLSFPSSFVDDTPTPRPAVEWAFEHGFRAVELSGSQFRLQDLSQEDQLYLRSAARERGLRYSYHFPSDTAPGSHDPERRRRDLAELVDAIRVASHVGVEVIVVHPGELDVGGSDGASLPEGVRHEALGHLVDFIGQAAVAAENAGVLLCLENLHYVPGWLIQAHSDLVQAVDAVDSSSVAITFDVGHAWGSEGVQQGLEIFGERIRHVHVHDCSGPQGSGNAGQHQEIGTGRLDFGRLSDLVRPSDQIVTLEVWSPGDHGASILRSRAVMKAAWGESVD